MTEWKLQVEVYSIEQYCTNTTIQYLSLSFMGSSRRCRGRFFRIGDRICIGWLIGAHLHHEPGHQSQRRWRPVLLRHFLQGQGQVPVQWAAERVRIREAMRIREARRWQRRGARFRFWRVGVWGGGVEGVWTSGFTLN